MEQERDSVMNKVVKHSCVSFALHNYKPLLSHGLLPLENGNGSGADPWYLLSERECCIHSLIHSVFIEHLLYARHNARG